MDLTIRLYREDDFAALIAIFVTAVQEVASRDCGSAQVETWAKADRDQWALQRLNKATWVAVVNQLPVGLTDLEPDGHLDMMYVHAAYQSVGIATALLNQWRRPYYTARCDPC